jgi:hypothetical protein
MPAQVLPRPNGPHTEDDALLRYGLGTSPDPRATDSLLSLIAEPPAPKLKTPALIACLRRVVTGRVPREQKTGILEKLLALDGYGWNASAVLAELQWLPSVDSLRLAQSCLNEQRTPRPP